MLVVKLPSPLYTAVMVCAAAASALVAQVAVPARTDDLSGAAGNGDTAILERDRAGARARLRERPP